MDLYFFINGGGNWTHCGMRALFAVITNTDIPFLQLAIACGINWLLLRFFFKSQETLGQLESRPERQKILLPF